VHAQHLSSVTLVFQLLENFGINSLFKLGLPWRLLLEDNSGERNADYDQELLVDVVHEVLQVRIDTRLCINSGLLIGQQVIELYDSDRNCFEFLSLIHHLFQGGILDDLVGHDSREMSRFSHVPPVVAVQRRIQIVAQALKRSNQLLRCQRASVEDVLERCLPLVSRRVFVLQELRLRDWQWFFGTGLAQSCPPDRDRRWTRCHWQIRPCC